MTDLTAAVAEYMHREKEANAKKRGADHQRILAEVAKESGVDSAVLIEAVLDHSFSGAN